MQFNKTRLAALVLALALPLSVASYSAWKRQQPVSGPSSAAQEEVQNTSPFVNMSTKDLDGNEVDSSIFAENKLTAVNLWNLGLHPCIQEIPELDKINQAYADKGVAVKGLYYNFGEELSEADRTEIESLFSEAGATYQQLLISDDMMNTKALAEISAFPTTFYVDSEGNIVDMIEGSADFDGWTQRIDKVLEDMA